jgi:hypothetical protein
LTGIVLQPDGQPAAKAAVGLASVVHRGLTLREGGRLVNHGHSVNRATTDESGRFTLRTMVGAERLLVVHPSGCAVLPVASVTNVFIPLQPWGEITGQVFVGEISAANQSVNVGFGKVSAGDDLIPFDFNTTTDGEGRFHFTHVPLGVHLVQRLTKFYKGETGEIGFSHGQPVTVRAGETARVVLGGAGVAIIGRLEPSPSLENHDWISDRQALVQQRPDLPELRWEDFQGDHQAHLRASMVRQSQIAKYYLTIKADGSFRADDVLPGDYLLNIHIKAPPEDPLAEDAWHQPRRTLGQVSVPVAIGSRDAREVVDLGIITIPITNSVAPIATGAR